MDAAAGAMKEGAIVRVITDGAEFPRSLDSGSDGSGSQQLAHVVPPPEMDSFGGEQPGNPGHRPLPLERESYIVTGREGAGQNRDTSIFVSDQEHPGQYQDLEKGKVENTAAKGKDIDDAPSYHHQDSEDDSSHNCRVCHMSTVTPDAINLGCACKLDLGRVHKGCAEKWFNIKGNRRCEICGEIAQNVQLAGGTSCLDTQDIVIINNMNRGIARVMFFRSLAICLLWVAFIVLLYKYVIPILRRLHRNPSSSQT